MIWSLYVSFFRGQQSVFSVMINGYISIFDLKRKFLPCIKTKPKIILWKKFVDSGIVKTCDELDRRHVVLSRDGALHSGHKNGVQLGKSLLSWSLKWFRTWFFKFFSLSFSMVQNRHLWQYKKSKYVGISNNKTKILKPKIYIKYRKHGRSSFWFLIYNEL